VTAAPVTVFGAGAIGGFVGARLAVAGEDVLLVDVVSDHVAAIRTDGIRVSGAEVIHARPRACFPDEVEDGLATVLLAVKGRHTDDALAAIEPRLAPRGCVVSLQNGLEVLRVAGAVGRERAVGAFLTFGGHYAGPGEIVFGGRASFRIGELDGRVGPRIRELERLLAHAHPVNATDRILGLIWGKTALGAFYVATALADEDVVDLLDRQDVVPELGGVVAEVARVAEAVGIPCEVVDGFDPKAFARGNKAAERTSWEAQRRYWNGRAAGRTGVWRDLAIHRRPTEAPALLAPVLAAADGRGIAVPRLRRLLALVGDVESGRRELGRELLAELA
jgi:2-dehydropantoate 2-reductase